MLVLVKDFRCDKVKCAPNAGEKGLSSKMFSARIDVHGSFQNLALEFPSKVHKRLGKDLRICLEMKIYLPTSTADATDQWS